MVVPRSLENWFQHVWLSQYQSLDILVICSLTGLRNGVCLWRFARICAISEAKLSLCIALFCLLVSLYGGLAAGVLGEILPLLWCGAEDCLRRRGQVQCNCRPCGASDWREYHRWEPAWAKSPCISFEINWWASRVVAWQDRCSMLLDNDGTVANRQLDQHSLQQAMLI